MNTFLGLKPQIKTARKSIASFKVSVNSPIGTKNDLHHSYLSSFYPIFMTSILPLNFKKNKHASFKNNKMYTLLLSHGLKDFNTTFMNHTPLRFLGGAHLQ
jgi:ribosomal protein L5